MSLLDETYEEAKEKFCVDDDDSLFKFDFAFALLAFCNDWHDGMSSTLYGLSSALTLEWQFDCGMDYMAKDNEEQNRIYQWLEKDKFLEETQ